MHFIDMPLVLAWRSDKEVTKYMPSAPADPTWDSQISWWDSNDQRRKPHFIVEVGNRITARPVGVVHLVCDTGEVGIYIGERSLWSKGIGTVALELLAQEASRLTELPLRALVHRDNNRSKKLFASCGYTCDGATGRNGQLVYVLKRADK